MSSSKARPAMRGTSLADLQRLRKQAQTNAEQTPKPAAGATVRRALTPPAGRAVAAAARNAPTTAPVQGIPHEDITLFRQAIRFVKPIKPKNQQRVAGLLRKDPADVLRNRRERATGTPQTTLARVSDHYTPAQLQLDDSRFLRNRHSVQLIKELEQGRWPVGAILDLHGNTIDQARERLDRFLQSCLEHEIRCVRIVHGKGYGSKDGEPVLRTTLRRWLTQVQAVQAYSQCPEADGGAGALNVLLHKTRPQPKAKGNDK